jgi:hypothetical protein
MFLRNETAYSTMKKHVIQIEGEDTLIKIRVDKKSGIILENTGENDVTVWSLEFTYTITVPREKLEDKNKFTRKKMTEKIRGPLKISPREKKEFPIKIPPNLLKQIDVYFEEQGLYKHEKMVLSE